MSEGIEISDGFCLVAMQEDQIVALSASTAGRDLAAATTDAGVRTTVSGEKSEGEHSTERAAELLVACMNRKGAGWINLRVTPGIPKIDFEADDESDSSKTLRGQVVRVVTDGAFWKALNTEERAERVATAADIWAAIAHKSDDFAVHERERVLLALDATETPGHAFPRVTASFLNSHGAEARQLGWGAIWIVGPSVALTTQLA